MEEPRPIAEQRSSASGALFGCAIAGAALVLLLAGVGAVVLLTVRSGATATVPMAPPAAPPRPPSGPPMVPMPMPTVGPAPLPVPVPGSDPVPAVPEPIVPEPVVPEPVAPEVEPGGTEVRGALDREVIHRVIRRHVVEVQRCYESGLAANPTMAGRVVVQLIIAGSGAVQTASITDSTLHDAAVEQCIVTRVRTWTFPAPDGGGVVAVEYPFVFTSSP